MMSEKPQEGALPTISTIRAYSNSIDRGQMGSDFVSSREMYPETPARSILREVRL